MPDFRIGCVGWSYSPWVGPFYPPKSKQVDFLKLYSRVFDAVEVDSTFYSIPNRTVVESWKNSVPDSFLFCPKVPKEITHDLRLKNPEKTMNIFLESMSTLENKLGPTLIQLPPSFAFPESFADLESFIGFLPADFQFAIEFRNNTWIRNDVHELLKRRKITLVWTEFPEVKHSGTTTTSTLYLRLIGDRSISERQLGTIRRDMSQEIGLWSRRVMEEKYKLDHVFAFANNHFQGFGPGTCNRFRQAIGLEPLDWETLMRGKVADLRDF